MDTEYEGETRREVIGVHELHETLQETVDGMVRSAIVRAREHFGPPGAASPSGVGKQARGSEQAREPLPGRNLPGMMGCTARCSHPP